MPTKLDASGSEQLMDGKPVIVKPEEECGD